MEAHTLVGVSEKVKFVILNCNELCNKNGGLV